MSKTLSPERAASLRPNGALRRRSPLTSALVAALVVAVSAPLFAGCGDDFEREELLARERDAQAQDVATDSAAADATADAATTDVPSAADVGASSSGGGFPGSAKACAQVSDCGDAPDQCVQWLCQEKKCVLADRADGDSCDDGEQCTEKDSCKTGKCTPGANTCTCTISADCASKEDGNACNGTLFCNTQLDPPKCEVNPNSLITCNKDGDTACAKNTCDEKTGKCAMAPEKDGTACNDDKECTTGDACKSGECAGVDSKCDCTKDADCGSKEDGDTCNGTLYCKRTVFPFKCAVNPATVVVCPTVDDTTCAKNSCDKKSGKCAMANEKDGGPCDDGNPCSEKDTCAAGKCAAGKNICGCQANADCDKHEDGDVCNGTLFCDKSAAPFACKVNPSTVIACDAANDSACSKNTCDKKTGKCAVGPVNEGEVCDDGNVCTVKDLCKSGTCASGDNGCDCTSDAQCGSFDDGNPCNGTLYCDKSAAPFKCKVLEKSVIKCQGGENTACAVEKCVPEKGGCELVALNEGNACNADDNACTKDDKCASGLCKPGPNACHCKSDTDCKASDDGDLCNGTLYCDTSAKTPICKHNPLSVVDCPQLDDSPCTVQLCDPKTGKCQTENEPDSKECNADDDDCTPDTCKSGKCEPGATKCSCATNNDCAKFNTGNKCDPSWSCQDKGGGKECVPDPASVPDCATQTAECVDADCDSKTGLCVNKAAPDGDQCDDGKVCSVGDFCDGKGKCEPGLWKCKCDKNADCAAYQQDLCDGVYTCESEGNFKVCKPKPGTEVVCPPNAATCTENVCNPQKGKCEPRPDPQQEGSACDDGAACSAKSSCSQGKCVKIADLQCPASKDPCLLFACKEPGGCTHVPAPNGNTCNDGSACTAKDACKGGKCEGKPGACEDGNACTENVCAGKLCKTSPVADNTKCDIGDKCKTAACKAMKCVQQGTKLCDDKNPCTDDFCVAVTGECKTKDKSVGTVCDDNNPCTKESKCAVESGKLKCISDKLPCDDGDVCTVDLCTGTKGCTHGKKVCSGNLDACKVAFCDPKKGCQTKTKDCDDGDPCTKDSCVALKGCQYTKADASTCKDDSVCTMNECKYAACLFRPHNDDSKCGDGKKCKFGHCGNPSCGVMARPDLALNSRFHAVALAEKSNGDLVIVAAGGGRNTSDYASVKGLTTDSIFSTDTWVQKFGDKTRWNAVSTRKMSKGKFVVCLAGAADSSSKKSVSIGLLGFAELNNGTFKDPTAKEFEPNDKSTLIYHGVAALGGKQTDGVECFAVGEGEKSGLPTAVIHGFDKGGAVKKSKIHSAAGGAAATAVAFTNKGLLIAGWARTKPIGTGGAAPREGLVSLYKSDLSKVEWTSFFPVTGGEEFLHAVAPAPNGKVWAAGTRIEGVTKRRATLRRLDDKGKSELSKVFGISKSELRGLSIGEQGVVFAVGTTTTTGENLGMLTVSLTAAGAQRYRVVHTFSTRDILNATAWDGKFLVSVGSSGTGGGEKGFLLRTDSGGRKYCK